MVNGPFMGSFLTQFFMRTVYCCLLNLMHSHCLYVAYCIIPRVNNLLLIIHTSSNNIDIVHHRMKRNFMCFF